MKDNEVTITEAHYRELLRAARCGMCRADEDDDAKILRHVVKRLRRELQVVKEELELKERVVTEYRRSPFRMRPYSDGAGVTEKLLNERDELKDRLALANNAIQGVNGMLHDATQDSDAEIISKCCSILGDYFDAKDNLNGI